MTKPPPAAPKADAPEIDRVNLFIRRKALKNLSVVQIVTVEVEEAGEYDLCGARGLGHRAYSYTMEQAKALWALRLALLYPTSMHPILWNSQPHRALHIDMPTAQKRRLLLKKQINDVLYMVPTRAGVHTMSLPTAVSRHVRSRQGPYLPRQKIPRDAAAQHCPANENRMHYAASLRPKTARRCQRQVQRTGAALS